MDDVGGLARINDFKVSFLPIKYLGLLLGATFKAKSIWNVIIERMEGHFASWKRL